MPKKTEPEEQDEPEEASVEKPSPQRTPVRASRKKLYFWIFGGLIVLAGLTIAGLLFFGGKEAPSSPSNGENANATNATAPVRRALDGVLDAPERERLPVVALVIENHSKVRPQAGLDQASVVYEALAEGGITRFLAVYTMTGIFERIGPVRSSRPYFLDWVKEYDALFGHVGGSPEALAKAAQYEIRDLDQFFNARYYWRDPAVERPHNLFTASKFLIFALRDKDADKPSTFTPWTFADDPVLAARPEGEQTLTIDYSTFSYRVQWTYDRATNAYLRKNGDVAHQTPDGKQLTAKNVIVLSVKTSIADAGRLHMETTGEGKAVIFKNGKATEGLWKKPSRDDRMTFVDTDGKPITLTAGQTWIEVVPTDRKIEYTGQPTT